MTVIASAPARTGRSASTRRSNNGAADASSRRTKTTAAAVPTTNVPSTHGSVMPRFGASMMAATRPPSANTDSTAATTSSGTSPGRREVGTTIAAPMTATIVMGTFTRKIEPNQWFSRSTPPITGPTAMPKADTPAKIAMARARSSGGKITPRIDSAGGITSAAPKPVTTRPATTPGGVVDSAAMTHPRPKTTIPIWKTPLRPNRSASPPPSTTNPPRAMVNPSKIHWMSAVVAPSSAVKLGTATPTMLTSIPISRIAIVIGTSASHRNR